MTAKEPSPDEIREEIYWILRRYGPQKPKNLMDDLKERFRYHIDKNSFWVILRNEKRDEKLQFYGDERDPEKLLIEASESEGSGSSSVLEEKAPEGESGESKVLKLLTELRNIENERLAGEIKSGLCRYCGSSKRSASSPVGNNPKK